MMYNVNDRARVKLIQFSSSPFIYTTRGVGVRRGRKKRKMVKLRCCKTVLHAIFVSFHECFGFRIFRRPYRPNKRNGLESRGHILFTNSFPKDLTGRA